MVHVSPEEFVMMQLAGELMPWEFPAKEGLWWSQRWGSDGRFVCKCGLPNTEGKTSHEDVGNP